jgi:hypothetical protein
VSCSFEGEDPLHSGTDACSRPEGNTVAEQVETILTMLLLLTDDYAMAVLTISLIAHLAHPRFVGSDEERDVIERSHSPITYCASTARAGYGQTIYVTSCFGSVV